MIATATKALQDQLADKDLPFLAEHLDRPFTFSVLKGRSNYVCRQRVHEAATSDAQGTLEQHRIEEVRRLADWAETSPTGDRAELNFEPSVRAWSAVSVGLASARAPATAHVAATASPSRPGPRPPRPTWSWSTPTSTASASRRAARCCPSTTW